MTAWQTLKESPRRSGAAAAARPALRSVATGRATVSAVPFAVMMVSLLVAGMIGLLVLNTALQEQAFALRAAQREASELGYRVSDLQARVHRANSPSDLARRAVEAGMVPNPNAVFIDLGSGTVLGKPTRVTGNEIPSLTGPPPAPSVPRLDAKAPEVDPSNPQTAQDAAPPEQTGAATASAEGAKPATEGAAATQGATG